MFSQHIEKQNQNAIQSGLNSTFIRQLSDGTLDRTLFNRFIAQDTHFVINCTRALGVFTSKAKDDDIPFFIELQKTTFFTLENVHSFYACEDNFDLDPKPLPSLVQLTSVMIRAALHTPIEVGFCAMAPVPWFYHIFGKKVLPSISPRHPYYRWFSFIGSTELGTSIENYKNFIDRCAEANPAFCEEMSSAARGTFLIMDTLWQDICPENNG